MAKKKKKKKAKRAAKRGTRKPRKRPRKSSKKKSAKKKSRATPRKSRSGVKKAARRPAKKIASRKSSPKKAAHIPSRPAGAEISGQPGWGGTYAGAPEESPGSQREIPHKTGGESSGSDRPTARIDKQEGETEW